MLNEELLDEKDKKIAQLEILIRRYKAYDKKRMEYVRDLEKRYNELRSQFDEEGNIDTARRLTELQKGFDTVNKKLALASYPEYIDEYNEDMLNGAYKFVTMKKQIRQLQEKVKGQAKEISELVYKLVQSNQNKNNETIR